MNCLKYQILPLLACALMLSCTQESDGPEVNGNAVELTGVKTVIGDMVQTRADAGNGTGATIKEPTPGYIGREFFVANDQMTITKFQRTDAAMTSYSYKDISFKSNANGAWTRTTTDPDRIYWTDNSNPHTFIGYSCPQAWNSDIGNKWKSQVEGDGTTYYGYLSHDADNIVDFSESAGGDEETDDEKESRLLGKKIAAEDLLLTYNTQMQAEPGGSVAMLHYKHALASVRVVVNIQNFAADEKSADAKTLVSNLQILNQPWKYKWAQIPVDNVNGIAHPGWGVQKLDDEKTVTIKTWLRDPQGNGNNRNKTFTFRSLIVPGKQDSFPVKFSVTYPDARDTTKTVTKIYKATLTHSGTENTTSYREGVYFEPGKTTTINISLNHANEEITIGAEYIDWENEESPNQSNLSKYSTYLSKTERTAVTIAGDANATIEDATWLYYNSSNQLVDIFGNDGSVDHPFVIKTALQFLSFAYEVKEGNGGAGRDFNGLNVKLDASLVLQPETEPESDDKGLASWAKTNWIGIGDADHAFNGTFIGTTRYVRYLQGAPLFANIGANGKVCGLTLENVISVTSDGMLAGKNAGTICACIANIHNKTNFTSAFSGLCGTNTGAIVACGTIGPDNAREANAGICGTNSGSIIACYSGIKSKAGVAATNTNNKGTITGCYYDKDKASGAAVDGSEGKTTEEMQLQSFVTTLNGVLDNCTDTHLKDHRFGYRAAYYPNVK